MWFKTSLALVILAGLAVAVYSAGDPLEFLAGDPKRSDYTWLREELAYAEDIAEGALSAGRRRGTLAAAKALEQAIRASRASARSTGTEPIPEDIQKQFRDYFPKSVLEEVRGAFPNRYLDLGSLVAWYNAEGGAVTLNDTIVYASPRAAESEYLWAHELTHVMQYNELGLDDFCRVYVTNSELLERQARENANRIIHDIRSRSRSRSAPTPTAHSSR